jgi:outer membrane protein assembly factor BamB
MFVRLVLLIVFLTACEITNVLGFEDCQDAPSGKMRWVFNTSAKNVGDASQIVDGNVYFSVDSGNSTFYALDAMTGLLKWQHVFSHDYSVREKMPSVYAGLVFVVPGYGQVWALDTLTGACIWKFQSDLRNSGDWTSNPQVDLNSGLLFTSSLNFLYALDAKTGSLAWNQSLPNVRLGTGATAWVENSIVYITGDDGLHAISVRGELLWMSPWFENVTGSATATVCSNSNTVAILASGVRSNSLLGFNSVTGHIVFNFTLPDTIDKYVICLA